MQAINHQPSAARQGHPAQTIIAIGVVVAMLYLGRVFLITLVIAVILSFILDPAVRLFMRAKLPRGLASFVVCSIALLALYLAGLGVYTEASALVDDLPAFSQRISQLVDNVGAKIDEVEKNTYQPRRHTARTRADQEQAHATRRAHASSHAASGRARGPHTA